jgi:predicted transposase/invertase (TIGR01784 family)
MYLLLQKMINMPRYLNPKNDLTFKRIFAEHPELLINFLNAVMPFEEGRLIEEVEYLPSDMPPENPTRKYSLVDVRCRDNDKRLFIVEMQMYWDQAFYNRMVFNAGKAYVRQLGKGEYYDMLKPVYTLALLNENFDHKTEQFYHHFQIVNRENTDEIIPGLEFVMVELTDKFRPETISDRRLMVLWLRFLCEVGEDMNTLPPEMQENEFIRQAAGLCEEGAFTPEELAAYEKYWDIIRTEKTLLAGAIRKGEAIGLEKGKTERDQLKAELQAAQKIQENMIVNMYRAGSPVETIADITGLTPGQVTEILKQ